MKLMTAFQSRLPSSRYIFKDGTVATFVNGEFLTDVESQIAELMSEINSKNAHPYIYVDPERKEVDIEADPQAALKAQIRAELEAEMLLKNLNPSSVNMGSTEGKAALNVATSASISPGAASSGSVGARLANLVAKS